MIGSVDFDKLILDLEKLECVKEYNSLLGLSGTIFEGKLSNIALIKELSKTKPHEKIPYAIFDKLYNGHTGIIVMQETLDNELFLRIQAAGQFYAIFPVDVIIKPTDIFYDSKPSMKINTSKYDMYLYCGIPHNEYIILVINSCSHTAIYEKYSFDDDNYTDLRAENLFEDEELNEIIESLNANKLLINMLRQNEKEW
jgi:predicted nucleic-acid-binding Zn-ribbon protein